MLSADKKLFKIDYDEKTRTLFGNFLDSLQYVFAWRIKNQLKRNLTTIPNFEHSPQNIHHINLLRGS